MTSEIIQVIAPKRNKERTLRVVKKLHHIAKEEGLSVSAMAWKLLSDAVLKYSPVKWE